MAEWQQYGAPGPRFTPRLSPVRQRVLIGLLLVAAISVLIFWVHVYQERPDHVLHNALLGRLPKPTEPELTQSLQELITPEQEYQEMVIAHIPEITLGTTMPHPFVGPCINCHLIKEGAKAGSQYKTPYGAALEQFSKYVFKPGPNITPTSERPHPPAGRCIKCHDLVVLVPVEPTFFKWETK
ncbi:MAG: hypothetical protein HQL48_02190 [Gammaproteobacteria bacterium]|nr:hypothetical protein [Gammaproteobacteria bacterium]